MNCNWFGFFLCVYLPCSGNGRQGESGSPGTVEGKRRDRIYLEPLPEWNVGVGKGGQRTCKDTNEEMKLS